MEYIVRKCIAFAVMIPIVLTVGCSQTDRQKEVKISGEKLTQIQKEVWNMEEAYWEYLKKGDLEGYMTLWHPDFIGWPRAYGQPVHRDSLWILIKSIMDNSKPGSLSYELKPYAVNVFGNIAIVFYTHSSEYENLDGEEIQLTERITHTWMKHEGRWKIISGISAL